LRYGLGVARRRFDTTRMQDMRHQGSIALLVAVLVSGCSDWTGFGFRADGPERLRLRQALSLKTGMVVADVGAGKGELTFALAAEVGPSGRVFSTEIDPARAVRLREAISTAKLGHVSVVEARVDDTGLPAGCCDVIVLRRVYHHVSNPSRTNASLLRSLRPGGVLAVIDFPPPFFLGRGEFGVPAQAVINEVTIHGMELVRSVDDWPGRGPLASYCAIFRKLKDGKKS
jgi:ubiquinone/menaquinone biosynthesis C-methylase UbiE